MNGHAYFSISETFLLSLLRIISRSQSESSRASFRAREPKRITFESFGRISSAVPLMTFMKSLCINVLFLQIYDIRLYVPNYTNTKKQLPAGAVEACRELYGFCIICPCLFGGEDYLITLIEEPSVYLMMFTPFCRSFTCVPARV